MNPRAAIPVLIGILIAGMLCGCRPTGTSYRVDPPPGFAVYSRDTESFRSIASDGLRIRIRRVDNEPRGNAAMWAQAIEAYLKEGGYHRISEEKIVSGDGREGIFTEYACRFNAEDFRYAVTVFAGADHLYLVEAGGKAESFARKRDGILGSIRTFRAE